MFVCFLIFQIATKESLPPEIERWSSVVILRQRTGAVWALKLPCRALDSRLNIFRKPSKPPDTIVLLSFVMAVQVTGPDSKIFKSFSSDKIFSFSEVDVELISNFWFSLGVSWRLFIC